MNERLCVDCGRAFVIGPEQAARYAARGWAPPRRCPACRSARRKPHVDPADPVDALVAEPTPALKSGKKPPPGTKPPGTKPAAPPAHPPDPPTGLTSSSDIDYDLEDPPDVPPESPGPPATEPEAKAPFEVQCAACGKLTRVAFRPTGKRPVYCRECFELR